MGNDKRFINYLKMICEMNGWTYKERGRVNYNVPSQQAYDTMIRLFREMSEEEKNAYL